MSPNLLPGCVSPLLANMANGLDSIASISTRVSSGQPAGWLMTSDVVMAALVPICVMMIVTGMVYVWGFLANDPQGFSIDSFGKRRNAANPGDDDAEVHLGLCYATGEGVPKDAEEAVKCYRNAAQNGHAIAQYNLALAHYHGEGVEQDLAEAVRWFHAAASQGLADALLSLGVCHANGVGLPKDKEEAAKCYRAAAKQGHAKAQFNLGLCYSGGHGVPKDHQMAYVWWNVSAAAGSAEAAKKRDALARRMTKEDVADAQRLCRNWLHHEAEAIIPDSETSFVGSEMAAAQAA